MNSIAKGALAAVFLTGVGFITSGFNTRIDLTNEAFNEPEEQRMVRLQQALDPHGLQLKGHMNSHYFGIGLVRSDYTATLKSDPNQLVQVEFYYAAPSREKGIKITDIKPITTASIPRP